MADVTFTPNHQPAPACYPADANALLDMLTTGGGLSGTVPDNAGGGIFVGSTPPASSLTNKVWYKTDAAGRPLGVYMFYNGNWRKVYTGAAIGQIVMCQYYSGLFDGTGRGIIGGDYDGWVICNGQNGAPNLEGYFPVCGAPGENVGQASGVWFTDADGLAWRNAGGQKGPQTFTIVGKNLPGLIFPYHEQRFGIQTGGSNSPLCYVDDPAQTPRSGNVVDAATGLTGQSVPITPPFPHLYIALGFLMFVGYQ